jgi:acetyl-CoA C-acetyltransferase
MEKSSQDAHIERTPMTDAFIYDALRTPRGRGKADGALHEITPIELASQALRALRDRNRLDTALIDDVILGCVTPVGELGADIARIAALNAGFAETVAGVQINRFCASGLEAVNLAAAKVIAGEADFVVGGGVESMSRVPMSSDGGAWPTDPAVAFRTYFVPQGISADLIATKFGYSRTDVDRYAVESQKRAARAWREKRFKKSILPVTDVLGLPVLDHDEHPRPGTDLQALAALKPAFAEVGQGYGFDSVALQKYPEFERIEHVHTAGNSSGIVDGAAAVLVGSRAAGKKAGLKPRARILGMASIGTEPTIMLTAPSFAAEKALKKARMKKSDIELWEINEAFSAVVLRFMEALSVDHGQLNVNGGAIAMGHPLGATGAMLLGTALDELERARKATALVGLCIGAGMGTATIIEQV